jgi:hypothetical protein
MLTCGTSASRTPAADRRRVKPGNGLAGAEDWRACMPAGTGREGCSLWPEVGAYRTSEPMGHIAAVWRHAVEAEATR